MKLITVSSINTCLCIFRCIINDNDPKWEQRGEREKRSW